MSSGKRKHASDTAEEAAPQAQNVSFAELREYFDSKVASIENKITDENERINKKLKKGKQNIETFKYKGNHLQYKFNMDLLELVEEAMDLWKQGSVTRLEDCFADIKSSISKRNKLIKIADRSEAGWETVREYSSDDLAENSSDEKKLRAAEERAIKKLKRSSSSSKTTRNYNPNNNNATPVDKSRITTSPSNHQFRNAKYNQNNTNIGPCFACGKFGHLRKRCPSLSYPQQYPHYQPYANFSQLQQPVPFFINNPVAQHTVPGSIPKHN